MADNLNMQSQVNIKNKQEVILRPDQIRILHWDNAVVIHRENYRRIPSDIDIVSKVKLAFSESTMIDSSVAEQILDKTIYYYFHFLMSQNQSAKSHYYNGFMGLVSDMSKLGHSRNCFNEVKTIAILKKRHADQIVKVLVGQKNIRQGALSLREISLEYDQFRVNHTAYGEHILPILSYLVKNWSTQFY